ncbi:hypothetical protein FRC12_000737 [Ceratobasidium sp. 428]|nr:hypothetical protein FRC12_000737 [Ceratobasidium sp. 428]
MLAPPWEAERDCLKWPSSNLGMDQRWCCSALMEYTHFLVVGANRGIGYELVNQILKTSSHHKVAATYRDPSKLDALKRLLSEPGNEDRLLLIHLDMNDPDSCHSAAGAVLDSKLKTLDVVIVNAGVNLRNATLTTQDLQEVANILDTNLLGPLRVCQAFVPLLKSQSTLSKLVLMSSEAGSISEHKDERSPAYGISKAALNMAGRKLSAELLSHNITVALVHPGWVKTGMGGPNAQISTETSVTGMLKVIGKLDLGNSGEFWNYDGSNHNW